MRLQVKLPPLNKPEKLDCGTAIGEAYLFIPQHATQLNWPKINLVGFSVIAFIPFVVHLAPNIVTPSKAHPP